MKVQEEMGCLYGMTQAGEGDAKREEVRAAAMSGCGIPLGNLVMCEQVHGSRVEVVSGAEKKIFPETDGLVTESTNVALGIFTADCLPIFLFEPETRVVGIVHAGWKGLWKKILPAALQEIRNREKFDISRTRVHIGPHIQQCCYEVGPETARLFPEECQSVLDQKIRLSLRKAAVMQARECGISERNVSWDRSCTQCDGRFFSYRKDRTSSRMLSFIVKRGS